MKCGGRRRPPQQVFYASFYIFEKTGGLVIEPEKSLAGHCRKTPCLILRLISLVSSK
jgi:hypothetical protein